MKVSLRDRLVDPDPDRHSATFGVRVSPFETFGPSGTSRGPFGSPRGPEDLSVHQVTKGNSEYRRRCPRGPLGPHRPPPIHAVPGVSHRGTPGYPLRLRLIHSGTVRYRTSPRVPRVGRGGGGAGIARMGAQKSHPKCPRVQHDPSGRSVSPSETLCLPPRPRTPPGPRRA